MAADVLCVGCALGDVLIKGVDVENDRMRDAFVSGIHYVPGTVISVGGDALNEAIILGKLGCNVQLMCGLGRDMTGELVTFQAQKAGVDTSAVVYHPTCKSGVNVLLIQEDTEKYYFSEVPNEAMQFVPDYAAFEGAKVVTLGSLFHAPFGTAEPVRDTLKRARECGAITCVDVITSPLRSFGLEDLGDALNCLDFIFPNEEEGRELTGKTHPEDVADALLAMGIGNVVLKLGSKGCFIKNSNIRRYVPAFPGKAVDATGAGDSFLGGFVAALLDGKDLVECCRFASAVALLVVENVGANTGIKNREQVLGVLEKYKDIR